MMRIKEQRTDIDDFDFLDLIDYEKEFVKNPRRNEFGILYFRMWLKGGIHCYWERESTFNPNLLALNLMTTSSRHLFSGNTETPRYYNETEGCLEVLSDHMYRLYEFHTFQTLDSLDGDSASEASLILRKMVKVFNIFQYGQNEAFASTLQETCFQEMRRHEVNDAVLVVDLLKATCLTSNARRSLLDYDDEDPNLDEERSVMEAARLCRFQFWGYWCRDLLDKSETERFCPCLQSFLSGNVDLLHLLFDYGFQVDLRPMKKEIWIDNCLWNSRYSFTSESLPAVISSRILLITFITRVMQTPYFLFLAEGMRINEEEADPQETTPAEQRRQRYVSQFNSIYANASSERYVECLKLIWRSVPFPYIKREEYMDVFKTVLTIPGINLSHWRSIYNAYETIVPECCDTQQRPRSLMHQCRSAIRNQLHQNWMMPRGIQQLEIPLKLKDYLMLKW